MKIVNQTELMNNQKASTIIVPDKQFEAVQTIEGKALVLSITPDGILYCTREVPGDTHGWVRVNLTPTLTQLQQDIPGFPANATISAKTFDIAQDLATITNSVDIALVMTVANTETSESKDYLYMAVGFINTFDNWTTSAPSFSFYGFDYPGESYQGLPINEVQILDSNDGNGMQYIIADIITNASTQTISRFYIDVLKQQGYGWKPHDLSNDLMAGKITTFIGCGPNDGPDSYPGAGDSAGNNIGGAYVLGSVAGKPQLQYTPAYNFEHPEETPNPTVFNFPGGTNDTYMAMDVSTSAANAPYTDLFFATNGQLYFLACADQNDSGSSKPTPVSIYTHALFQNIQSLHVKNWNDNIVIWGQSLDPADMQTSRLFIMEGVSGQETNTAAWSTPIPILSNVVNSSAYVNNIHSLDSSIDPTNGNAYGSCSVLFAEQVVKNSDGTYSSVLTQLFQDPVTTAWQARSLLTAPSPENIITEIYDTTTYSTHIEITDDNNVAACQQLTGDDNNSVTPMPKVAVWASSPCSVYITDANNTSAYHTLDTVQPLLLTPDFSANVAIMQPVDTIGGISYYVAVQDPASQQIYTEVINPLSGTSGTIATLNAKVPDGNDHLQGVQVTDEYGTTTQLVGGQYNAQTAPISHNINTMCQQNAHMDQDGLTQGQSWPDAAAVAAAFAAVPAAAATLQAKTTAVKPGPKSRVSHKGFPTAKNRVKKFAKADRQAKHIRFNPATDKIWGWKYGKNAKQYEGVEAIKEMGMVVRADGSLAFQQTNGQLLGSDNWIEAKAGHLFKWMQSEADKLNAALENIIQVMADGFVHCLLTIAGEVYHFIVKCANDIVNLVHTVLNAIETAFKDLIAWIGMLFNFQDILRTHNVMSTIINVYINNCLTGFSQLSTDITTVFNNIKQNVDQKTGLPVQGLPSSNQTYGGAISTGTPPAGSKSSSANYGTHHLKNNAKNSDNSYSSTYIPVSTLFDSLLKTIENEGTAFSDAAQQIKAIIAGINNTPFTTTITQFMGVVVDLLLNSAENFLQEVVTVLEALLSETKDVLNAAIHIPVLTWFYKKITKSDEFPDGKDLTPLDLFCLISAIPATVVYKVVKGEAPFPAGATTNAIIKATDMTSLEEALAGLQTVSSVSTGLLGGNNTGKTTINIVSSIAATVGAVAVDLLLLLKSQLPREMNESQTTLNKVFSVLQCVGYMGYILPDVVSAVQSASTMFEPDNINNLANNTCTFIAVVKYVVDASSAWWPASLGDPYGQTISPVIDFFFNIAWQVPTVIQLLDSVSEHGTWVSADVNAIVSCIGGTAFDLSGVLSPWYADAYYFLPPSAEQEAAVLAAVVGISACNLVWAGSCLATTFDGLPIPS